MSPSFGTDHHDSDPASAPQPLTGDELATIKARAEQADSWPSAVTVLDEDVPRLVAEIERLQALVEVGREFSFRVMEERLGIERPE